MSTCDSIVHGYMVYVYFILYVICYCFSTNCLASKLIHQVNKYVIPTCNDANRGIGERTYLGEQKRILKHIPCHVMKYS
jgi:hypothetical protein